MEYKKKPVVIEAFQFGVDQACGWFMQEVDEKKIIVDTKPDLRCLISTLEGIMQGNDKDFIIRGIQGEIYPCKPDIFKETYEKVDLS